MGETFFSKIFHRCYSWHTGLERRRVLLCCWHDTFRDWSCLLSLEEFSQLPLKSAQCGFGSQSPQENLRSLARPEVEVKFYSTMI